MGKREIFFLLEWNGVEWNGLGLEAFVQDKEKRHGGAWGVSEGGEPREEENAKLLTQDSICFLDSVLSDWACCTFTLFRFVIAVGLGLGLVLCRVVFVFVCTIV